MTVFTSSRHARKLGLMHHHVRGLLSTSTLTDGVPPAPPSRLGSQPRLIEPFIELVESWLRTDLSLKASVIHKGPVVTECGL